MPKRIYMKTRRKLQLLVLSSDSDYVTYMSLMLTTMRRQSSFQEVQYYLQYNQKHLCREMFHRYYIADTDSGGELTVQTAKRAGKNPIGYGNNH